MNSTDIFGIVIGALALIGLSLAIIRSLPRRWIRFFRSRLFSIRSWFLASLYYPVLAPVLGFRPFRKRFDILLFLIILAGNSCAVSVGAPNIQGVSKRLGHAALINLILLSFGARLNYLSNKWLCHYERHVTIHGLIGFVAAIEATLHTLLLSLESSPDLDQVRTVAGLVACCGAGAALCSSTCFFFPWLFDLYSMVHSSFAILILVSLWLHIPQGDLFEPPRLYILLASTLFAGVKLMRLVTIAYLSRRSLATVQVDTNRTMIQISVRPTRTLDVRAGQFFYLNLLDFSLTSAFRSHPFQVSWADRDANGRQVLDFIVQPRRGFTRKLLLADPRVQYKIALEGPYGRHPRLEEYVTVLMFATNAGISGHLLYMKELFALRQDPSTRTQKISLFWEIDAEVYRYWVREWMDHLLGLDNESNGVEFLDLHVFVRGGYLSSETEPGQIEQPGVRDRLTIHYYPLDARSQVASEIEKRDGPTIISQKS
ncbi:unnamed protein product [Clonostachys rosea f. rosea IK726]|uniref:Uncharacterized protein n=1 Tax=Clonostachys rosea f. rosea IK726 TaxID=1349383 RepID=A0ACA9TEP5_BIOOC|nr:unnamed protein product [Clonostachys rosea f. rosea IK726]